MGGEMRGSGQTIVNGPSTLNTEQGFADEGRPLYERTLTFADTVTVEQGFLDTREGATVVVEANAVVQFPDDRTGIRPLEYTSPRPVLENRGTIVKTGRGDSFYTSTLGYQEDTFRGDESITIVNTGVIRSEVGTLTIYVAEDTDVGGIVETTSNGRMNFFRARFSSDAQLDLSATVQGEGTFNFSDAYRFTGTFDLTGTALLRGGQLFDPSMTIQRASTLRLRTSRDEVFTFAAPDTPAIDTFLVQGLMEQQSDVTVTGRLGFGSDGAATLSGSGTVTVGPDGEMLWGAGRLGGSGTVDVQGRLTAVVASYLAGDFQVQESEKWLDGRTMIVRGPATWDDATLNFENGGFLDLRSESVFDLQRDAIFQLGAQAVGEEGMRLGGQFVKSGVGRRTSTGSEPVAYDDGYYGATFGVPTQNEGTLSVEAGTAALQNATFTNSGVVQGTDTLDVSQSDSFFDNQGIVGPGTSPGRLTIVGEFDNTGATLSIELAGTTAGDTYDQLSVLGAATLGGTLDLMVRAPFDPPGDSEYVILTAESLTGTFDTLNLPSLDGRTVEVETTDTEVRVRVVETVTNADPVAVNDTTETTAGTPVLVDVLANDSDPDDDPLTIISVGTPASGITQIEDGRIRYSPPADFVGEAVFSYQVSDGNGGGAEGTVVVSVFTGNTAPVATTDSVETESSRSVLVDVLANDSDPDGDPLTISSVGTPTNGTATIVAEGIEYTPADGFTGEDSFSYQIADGNGGTAQGTVVVTVVPGNTPPVAADDVAATDAGTPVVIDVLANDTDSDGDPLTVSDVGAPSNGTATSVDGGIEYTPADGFSGEDAFTYVVSDGRGGTDEATVTVSVAQPNAAPVAANDSVGTEAGTSVVVDVLANDQDADGDVLFVENVGAPDSGTATLVDGGIEYTPNDGFVGGDAFAYTVADGNGGTDQATVTVTVVRGNTAPVAEADSAETEANTSVVVEVLANDSDPDGDPLTVTGIGSPSNGTVRIESDGTVARYTPAQDFVGEDAFTYQIGDGNGGMAEAPVSVTVIPPNGAPVARADEATTEQGTAVRIAVLTNDTDPDEDPLRIAAVGTPENGSAQIDEDVIVYTPTEGFTGTDTFTYTVADSRDATGEATVTVTVVRPNAVPLARDDAAATVRDTPVIVDVLANDADEDGDPLSVAVTADPTNGAATRLSDQTIRYAPEIGFTGTDTFRYRVQDGRGGTAEALVTVTVEGLRFTVTSLGTLGGDASRALAINDAGEVVGLSLTGEGNVRGFRWRNGAMRAISSAAFRPYALGDDGTAAGYVERDSTFEAALVGNDEEVTLLGTLGGRNSVAYALNADGEVVGTAQLSDGTYRAFRWAGEIRGLGSLGGTQSEAFGLNREGTAAGTVVRQAGVRAWVGEVVVDGSGDSRAYAVNSTGLAVGSALVGETVVARLWREGTAIDLGTGEGAWAEAYALNDAGWVVGTTTQALGANGAALRSKTRPQFVRTWDRQPAYGLRRIHQFGESMDKQAVVPADELRAFLWIDGEIRDLNDFVPPDAGWTLLEARHVNNRGQIVGVGLLDGAERAFLLTPTDNAAPAAAADQHTVVSGRTQVIPVLDNDTDEDGDRLRLLSVTAPTLGVVSLSADSSVLHYRADAQMQGTDAFSYVVSDGAGTTARGTVELRVQIYVDPAAKPVLEPSAPNPVRSRARIRYLLPETGPVRLEVFDVLGRRRAILVDERQGHGAKDVWLDVRGWAAGTYFCRLRAGGSVQTRALTVVR
jgi:probable HAF family extracellular repeat protein